MWPKFFILVAVILVSGAYVVWDLNRTPSLPLSVKDIRKNEKIAAPDATFESLANTSHTIHNHKGKVILLNFWATWCLPCKVEFPQLIQLAHENQEDMVFIALSVDHDPQQIEPYLQTFDAALQEKLKSSNIIIGLDTKKTISQDLYQTVMYPETYIIDRNMNIQKKVAGVIDWTGDSMRSFLESLIKEN